MSVVAGWFARGAMVAACSFGPLTACRAREAVQAPMDMSVMDSTDGHASQAVHDAMNGPMAADLHMTLTPPRPPRAADSIRAAALVREMRVALDRYRDVRAAEADGFRQFLPNVKQPVYHFTNRRWALAELFRFDATKPKIGGGFVPRLFGWMVHVMAFESDDPKIVWGGEPGHTHS